MKLSNFVGCVVRTLVRHRTATLSLALLTIVTSAACAAEPADWYQWRGPEGNGISREKNLPTTWSPEGENVVWSSREFASAFCTPIALNGKLYVVARYKPETTEEGECVICIDAETGEKLWVASHNVFLSDGPAERVGWASVVGDPETGNIYWLGLGSEFNCLDGETGKVLWSHSMGEEYGMLSTYGGRTNFPIVFEDLVIVSGVMTQWGENAVPSHRFVGFDKGTGASVWFSSTTPKPMDTTYSSPFLTSFDGQAAIVFGAGDGKVHAMQPRTGKLIWSYQASGRGIWTSPVVVDNIVYCGFHEQSAADLRIRGALFAFDGRKEGTINEEDLLWKIKQKEIERGQPVVVDGRLYVTDLAGELIVVDANTGEAISKRKIKAGRWKGQLTYGDGKIYCTLINGIYKVYEPTEEGVNELAHVALPGREIYAAPVIYRGRLYITTSEEMYCIGAKQVTPEADPLPQVLHESPRSEDQAIAHIQIAPVEAMLAPGQQTPYQVRAYNKNGQYLKVVDAEFEVKGGGEITADGSYTAPETAEHTAVYITATANGVSSTARVRVIPPLPWSFDFSDKQVPITWNGAAYRHQFKEVSGESVLVKRQDIPLGTRSQSWMGWTTLHDYTVQADVFATTNADNGNKPDMGIINQRYTLDLMGERGENALQIRSWTTRLENRFAKTIPFPWEPNTWYTLKLQSENSDAGATLRGKVWIRGEAEPEGWQIEATDAVPNTQGSPGLFGNSGDAEFYIDNVKVYKNE